MSKDDSRTIWSGGERGPDVITVLAVSLENCFSLQNADNQNLKIFSQLVWFGHLSSLKSWILKLVASVSPLASIADVDISITISEKHRGGLKHELAEHSGASCVNEKQPLCWLPVGERITPITNFSRTFDGDYYRGHYYHYYPHKSHNYSLSVYPQLPSRECVQQPPVIGRHCVLDTTSPLVDINIGKF